MRETESPVEPVEEPVPEPAAAPRDGADQGSAQADFGAVAAWARRRPVLLSGLLLIAAEIIWKAQFLSRLYLRQDDYVNQAIALRSPLNWRYLSLVGDGHLFPGVRAITWVLARISLYSWGLDAGVVLAFTAAASVAALIALRTLFGERPAILIPLAVYALCPLTLPDLGWWWCAMESVPLQLAIFAMLNAHVLYVRTSRRRYLVYAALWLAFGMLFFEKAMILAPLLFAMTAAFLTGARSWLGGALLTLKLHWQGWLVYGLLMIGYVIMFAAAFRTSVQQPQVPPGSVATAFGSALLKKTFLTGAIGGPWRWLPFGDGLYALAAPGNATIWLSLLIALGVLGASVVIKPRAWRAWAILAGWIVCADIVPVVVGRMYPGLTTFFAALLGLETRYLADAVCVLAVCLGLAFLPVIGELQRPRPASRHGLAAEGQWQRYLLPGGIGMRYAVVVMFVIGSLWSVQAYENVTRGGPAAKSYIANVEQAVRLASPGTTVLDQYMPRQTVGPSFGRDSLESFVLGAVAQGPAATSLHWISGVRGTIDHLKMFGADGKLYPAVISGVYSAGRRSYGACWPQRSGQITVRLARATSVSDEILHIGYLWGSSPATATVQYGGVWQQLELLPGVHNAYLPVRGEVSSFVVSGLGADHLCIGGAESGQLVPYGVPIP